MARWSGSVAGLTIGVVLLFSSFVCPLETGQRLVPQDESQLAYEADNQNVIHETIPLESLPTGRDSSQLSSDHGPVLTTDNAIHNLDQALSVLQDEYFSLWLGKWTTAIDWTAAVTNTYISATLSTLSRSFRYSSASSTPEDAIASQTIENSINRYFGQTTAFYYGEEAFAIRMQAFDDMLWVVLEWLESIRFINSHSSAHHAGTWHGKQFIPPFAHRARVFYDLATEGWDWRLCGGGMTWNPRLLPYKNAITNELWIAASVQMYLDFPGDANHSPFISAEDIPKKCLSTPELCEHFKDADVGRQRGRYNPIFRQNAINGYEWLANSGMRNEQGLYTDGFHIRDYRTNHSLTTCNERNEMVYTYNQGVILSGLRGLWEATGNATYLEEGYELIGNVIKATGWKTRKDRDKWHGLGSKGILTERCDPSGSCNQDGQTFKGIFFHHLTAFCESLPLEAVEEGRTFAASRELAKWHRKKCDAHTAWVVHNARAALGTRDKKGRFGSWWGASVNSDGMHDVDVEDVGAVDYRNDAGALRRLDILLDVHEVIDESVESEDDITSEDLNDRGRGRTVETQGVGLSVVRAMIEFLRWRRNGARDGD
ncbi:glycosyl hydrolase family 76-domain-containing protein [Paraphoma chrysanthemicola]|nr:glycosyl hydrolase family 76-domain-containing protein [Paraphoma chrysanthemicola]